MRHSIIGQIEDHLIKKWYRLERPAPDNTRFQTEVDIVRRAVEEGISLTFATIARFNEAHTRQDEIEVCLRILEEKARAERERTRRARAGEKAVIISWNCGIRITIKATVSNRLNGRTFFYGDILFPGGREQYEAYSNQLSSGGMSSFSKGGAAEPVARFLADASQRIEGVFGPTSGPIRLREEGWWQE